MAIATPVRTTGIAETSALTAMRPDLLLEVIPYRSSLWEEIGNSWSELVAARPNGSVFVTPVWIENWLHVYGEALRPTALVWRTGGGECVAIVLVTVQPLSRGRLKFRGAHINANGEREVGSEDLLLACRPQVESAVVADLVRYVLGLGVDIMCLEGCRSEVAQSFRAAWSKHSAVETTASDNRFVPLAELRQQATPFLNCLSVNTRAQIRRSTRLFEAMYGEKSIEVAARPQQAMDWFQDLRRLHGLRWRGRGVSGAFATSTALQFHERLLSNHLFSADDAISPAVDLMRIRFGSTVIGYLYNLRYRGVVSFYQSGFQYYEDNRLKPGLTAHAFAIQHYFEVGALEYDFQAGDLGKVQYKESLGLGSRTLEWVELFAATPKMRIFSGLRQLKRRLGFNPDRASKVQTQ